MTSPPPPLRDFVCPACKIPTDPPQWPDRCSRCGVRFGVFDFDPVTDEEPAPAPALPDDVACAHHPGKKAVEVCAGTGSYICSLCAVNMLGQTYSTAFIESGGLKTTKQADTFERKMSRPDSGAMMCLVLSLLMSCTMVGGVLLWSFGLYFFIRHRQAVREEGFYARRIAGSGTTAGLAALLIVSLLVNAVYITLVGFSIFVENF